MLESARRVPLGDYEPRRMLIDKETLTAALKSSPTLNVTSIYSDLRASVDGRPKAVPGLPGLKAWYGSFLRRQ